MPRSPTASRYDAIPAAYGSLSDLIEDDTFIAMELVCVTYKSYGARLRHVQKLSAAHATAT
jgi:hypothetical protein